MIDFETRARQAGADLRDWTPGTPTPPAGSVTSRSARRTRRHRIAAGTAVFCVAAAGVGLVWGAGHDHGDDVRTGTATTPPADEVGPSTTVPDPSPSTTGDPVTTATTVPATDPTPAPSPTASCGGRIGTVSYEVTLPDGWFTNDEWAEGRLSAPACRMFAPEPVEMHLGPGENVDGEISSNAVVRFDTPNIPGEPPPGTFDERMAGMASTAGVQDVQRTTIDGRRAARFDRISTPGDGEPGGERYVEWHIDLGTDELMVTAFAGGVSYDEAVAAADVMVHSLHFTN